MPITIVQLLFGRRHSWCLPAIFGSLISQGMKMDKLYKSVEQVHQELASELANQNTDTDRTDSLPDVESLELYQLPDLVLE